MQKEKRKEKYYINRWRSPLFIHILYLYGKKRKTKYELCAQNKSYIGEFYEVLFDTICCRFRFRIFCYFFDSHFVIRIIFFLSFLRKNDFFRFNSAIQSSHNEENNQGACIVIPTKMGRNIIVIEIFCVFFLYSFCPQMQMQDQMFMFLLFNSSRVPIFTFYS